jgi:hypothetical protein
MRYVLKHRTNQYYNKLVTAPIRSNGLLRYICNDYSNYKFILFVNNKKEVKA